MTFIKYGVKNRIFCLTAFLLFSVSWAYGQTFRQGKYGADFLSVGGGARPLGMGSAYAAITNDVTAGYWNPAGLARIKDIEVAYMHSERFSGIVGYDYGAVALPLQTSDGVLAVSFFRQGVDGIKNTLAVWNPQSGNSIPDPTTQFPQFSDNDYAFYISYSKPIMKSLAWGATVKVLHSKIGPFANAWGYSLDFGLKYHFRGFELGTNLMNIPTLFKFWQVNRKALEKLTLLNNDLPKGQDEIVMPTLKIGIGRPFSFYHDNLKLIAAVDADFHFDNRRTYYINLGRTSVEPHVGAELNYKGHIALRVGVTDFTTDRSSRVFVSPTLGAGITIGMVHIDYGFASFSGITKDLGSTNRISMRIFLNKKHKKKTR
ncbi:MAG TPA: PorV/PorQ family protein [Balneolales bacterium]|nr:PorV/PorQ family protein [Balneolales bacterium]